MTTRTAEDDEEENEDRWSGDCSRSVSEGLLLLESRKRPVAEPV